ncbi:MAG: hypothetical protein VXU48_00055, partial [Verrucomicrobiota bacterium]|nr:hypothetical protein [Verrucomicrobiota bacterium]
EPETDSVRDVTYFAGKTFGNTIADADDNLEAFLALGPNRYPVYPTQKLCAHYMFYLDALGKLNSDAHAPGVTLKKYRKDAMILGFNMEKAHSGSGASWSGVSTRNGDLLTVFIKNAPGASNKMMVTAHFEVVCRISAQGCDLLD